MLHQFIQSRLHLNCDKSEIWKFELVIKTPSGGSRTPTASKMEFFLASFQNQSIQKPYDTDYKKAFCILSL